MPCQGLRPTPFTPSTRPRYTSASGTHTSAGRRATRAFSIDAENPAPRPASQAPRPTPKARLSTDAPWLTPEAMNSWPSSSATPASSSEEQAAPSSKDKGASSLECPQGYIIVDGKCVPDVSSAAGDSGGGDQAPASSAAQ